MSSEACSNKWGIHPHVDSVMSCAFHKRSALRAGLMSTLYNEERVELVRQSTSPQMLAWVGRNCADMYVLEEVAQNAFTSAATLDHLSKSRRIGVTQAVARNPKTPQSTLMRLASGQVIAMREAIRNPSISLRNLDELSRHDDVLVRIEVARNPRTPHRTLMAMAATVADGTTDDVCTALRLNPAVQTAVLEVAMERGGLQVDSVLLPRKMVEWGMDPENELAAAEIVREREWWKLSTGSDAVEIAKLMHPDAVREPVAS